MRCERSCVECTLVTAAFSSEEEDCGWEVITGRLSPRGEDSKIMKEEAKNS